MLAHAYRTFVAEEAHIHVHKESEKGYALYADFVFLTEQFRTFQQTVIQEALSQIVELLDDETLLFDDIARAYEDILQQANQKLIAFAEKMTAVETFDIRGIVTIAYHTTCISAVIGDVSMVLIRKGHIGYTMQNDTDKRQKISLFSDIVEGDIGRDDVICFFGMHVAAIMDRDDLEGVAQQTVQQEYSEIIEQWEHTLNTRVALPELGLVVAYGLGEDSIQALRRGGYTLAMPQWVQNNTQQVRHILGTTWHRFAQKIQDRKFVVLAILAGVFLLFVVWSIVHGWIKNEVSHTINTDGSVVAQLSVEDIKKEIAEFQKLDPTSEEKGIKYNALVKELDRIQQEGKWANDVKQLKKILDMEYLQGFNIIVMDSLDDQYVYKYSSLEETTLGKPLQIFFQRGLYIAGTQGVVLAGISDDIRGTAVSNAPSDDFVSCSMDLLKTGLYCVNVKNTIFHIQKAGAELVGGDALVFPRTIAGVGTFGSANFYTLTSDPIYTKDNTYIIRYTAVPGSQNTFAAAMSLPLLPGSDTGFSQGFSSFAIDGSFLAWSKDKKALYQFFRNPQDKALSSRAIPLQGGTSIGAGLSDNVKVMTTQGTRYVYLYDRTNYALSAYLSSPAKNSDSYANNYALQYVMRLDLSKLQSMPKDVVVDESDGKQTAYVLTDVGVAKVPMSDLLETLKKTKDQFKK